jgi:hypothetical protein
LKTAAAQFHRHCVKVAILQRPLHLLGAEARHMRSAEQRDVEIGEL